MKSTDWGLKELATTFGGDVEVVAGALVTLALPARNSPAPKTTTTRRATSWRALTEPA